MSRVPRVTGADTVAALLRGGMERSHIRGSHHFLRWPNGSRFVSIPVHAGKTLKVGTLAGILDQAGLSVDAFIKLL